MEDDIYELAITHTNENPFKRYLSYQRSLKEFTADEETFYQNENGREFINLLENMSMSKVYKMPILMAFYNEGKIRQEVSKEQLLASWKAFFSSGTNWKDLDKELTYEKYNAISDKDHIKKILKMPVYYLLESGKGFFVKKEGVTLALKDEMQEVIDNPVFIKQMKDVMEYRIMDYYRRRYKEKGN